MLKDAATILRSAKLGRHAGGDEIDQDSTACTTKPSISLLSAGELQPKNKFNPRREKTQ